MCLNFELMFSQPHEKHVVHPDKKSSTLGQSGLSVQLWKIIKCSLLIYTYEQIVTFDLISSLSVFNLNKLKVVVFWYTFSKCISENYCFKKKPRASDTNTPFLSFSGAKKILAARSQVIGSLYFCQKTTYGPQMHWKILEPGDLT